MNKTSAFVTAGCLTVMNSRIVAISLYFSGFSLTIFHIFVFPFFANGLVLSHPDKAWRGSNNLQGSVPSFSALE